MPLALEGLNAFLLRLTLFWGAIHLAHHLYPRLSARASVLPTTHAQPHTLFYPHLSTSFSRSTSATLQALHLRIQTTALNGPHDALAARLSSRGRTERRLRWTLVSLYDLGSIAGVVGLLGALVLLSWTFLQLLRALFTPTQLDLSSPNDLHHFAKRDMAGMDSAQVGASNGGSIPLQALIPGVTVPASHFPLLLLALLFSQLIHEAGHAITAAMDSVPLLSVGGSLTLIFPSAFVALSSAATRSASPISRLRITSSGAFHNLVLWALLSLAACTSLGPLLWSTLGYNDTRAWGRVVTSVEQTSPLWGYLPVGSVVTKIDDTLLITKTPAEDIWTTLLSEPEYSKQDDDEGSLGWCVDRSWFVDKPTSCCAPSLRDIIAPNGPTACFASHESLLAIERCVDPLPFLSAVPGGATPELRRCEAVIDCGGGGGGSAHLCVRPRVDQQLLRLTVHLPDSVADTVVVWNGPRSEILEAVDVGTWLPRWSLLPVGLPGTIGTFFAYVQMISLSLYFFNLLPLSLLDGGQLVDAAYDCASVHRLSREDVELASLESGAAPSSPGVSQGGNGMGEKERVLRVLHLSSASLIGMCVLLSILNLVR